MTIDRSEVFNFFCPVVSFFSADFLLLAVEAELVLVAFGSLDDAAFLLSLGSLADFAAGAAFLLEMDDFDFLLEMDDFDSLLEMDDFDSLADLVDDAVLPPELFAIPVRPMFGSCFFTFLLNSILYSLRSSSAT